MFADELRYLMKYDPFMVGKTMAEKAPAILALVEQCYEHEHYCDRKKGCGICQAIADLEK